MVLFMHQLQLIGIKTNLESFVTTTLMEQMLNRHQLHLFLWVSKQWGDAITFTDFSSSKCKADITLPISYSRFFKAICCDWGNGAVATAVVTKGLAQITLYVAVAATAKPRASWITIGQ